MVRHGVRRISWGLVDQGASSLTTVCVSIGALRGSTSGASEFALVFLMHALAVSFSRSITTEPVAQDLALARPESVRVHVRASGLTGLMVGLVTALLAAALVRPDTGVGLWSLAFPLAIVGTDSIRAAWIGARQPARAVPYSAAQFAASAAGLLLTILTGNAVFALVPIVVVGGAMTLMAVVSGPKVGRAQLVPRHGFYAAAWLLTSGLSQSSALIATHTLPLLPLVVRTQGVLFGPISAIAQAVAVLAVPEFASLRRRRPSLVGPAVALTAFLMTATAVYAGLLLLVPEKVLSLVLGGSWLEYRHVILASIALMVTASAPMSPLIALRAHGYARTSLHVTAVLGIGHLLLPLGGVMVAGLPGFFWGSALSSTIGCLLSMTALRRAEKRAAAEPVGAT